MSKKLILGETYFFFVFLGRDIEMKNWNEKESKLIKATDVLRTSAKIVSVNQGNQVKGDTRHESICREHSIKGENIQDEYNVLPGWREIKYLLVQLFSQQKKKKKKNNESHVEFNI